MLLEVITPESKIFTGEVSAVQFPGMGGSFQVLNNHAPIISSLKSGEINIDLEEGISNEEREDLHKSVKIDDANSARLSVSIQGGVMEMNDNHIIVLAE